MAGYIDSPAEDAVALAAQGTEAIPESTGAGYAAVAAGTLAHAFPVYGATRYGIESMGADPNTGEPIAGWHDTDLAAKDATERYGVEGRLAWTAPVPESVAAEQSRRMHETILREDIIRRSSAGPIGRFAAGLVGGLPGIVDPLNLLASIIPVVPEARALIWAARAGEGAFAQARVRAGVGAIQGAVGMTALTPIYYGLSRAEGEDYGATDALLNIALGGIFGGGLHAALGRSPSPEAARTALAIERAAPETREALLRGGIADMAEGRPVETPATILPGEIGGGGLSITETGGATRPYERVPREPERLASYLQRQGGVRDEGGELANLLDSTRRRGLRNAQGMPLDEAALRAWQEGFLRSDAEGVGNGQPTNSALLEALDRDLRGEPVYREQHEFSAAQHREAIERNSEIDRLSQKHEIPVSGKTRQQFYEALTEKLGRDRASAEADRLAESAEAIIARADAEIPDFGANTSRTEITINGRRTVIEGPASADMTEVLNDVIRQETAARGADAGQGRLGEPAALGRATGADEAGAGRGGRGLGAGRRGEPEPGISAERAAELTAADTRPPLDRLNEEIATLERELSRGAVGAEEGPPIVREPYSEGNIRQSWIDEVWFAFRHDGAAAARSKADEIAAAVKLSQGAETILWGRFRQKVEAETGLPWREAAQRFAENGPERERPPELEAADRAVADAEGEARAIEQSGVCLGRRL